MTDYSKGKIYSIKYEDKIVYIGSTIQNLNKRMDGHRGDAKRRNSKLYNFMNEKGLENFKIELIEDYSCNSKKELLEREAYYQKLHPDRYNTLLASSTKEELLIKGAERDKRYREKNKEKVIELEKNRRKKYYDRNIESIKIQNKIDYTCECGSHLTSRPSLWQHKGTKKHQNFIANQNV